MPVLEPDGIVCDQMHAYGSDCPRCAAEWRAMIAAGLYSPKRRNWTRKGWKVIEQALNG